jgi:hypothetical protein
MEILLWDKEITVEDRKSGEELSIKVEASKLEVGGKGAFAERVATALVAAGLRRRPAPGAAKKGPPPKR